MHQFSFIITSYKNWLSIKKNTNMIDMRNIKICIVKNIFFVRMCISINVFDCTYMMKNSNVNIIREWILGEHVQKIILYIFVHVWIFFQVSTITKLIQLHVIFTKNMFVIYIFFIFDIFVLFFCFLNWQSLLIT